MIQQILLLLGGLGLLLCGMFQLGSTIQKLFSVRIRENIKHSVKKPIYGVLLGIVTTILAQSSSTISILTVGMVSAGVISFYHSLGIILGAIIGTTVTPQLVAFKLTAISPIFIIIGVLFWLAGKDKWKVWGEMIFYFGLLFFGLYLMGESMAQFKESPFFINLFKETRNPILGILIGAGFTLIVQASAIPISILVLLAQQGGVDIVSAVPIILGANLGTTIDGFWASLGANINGKRTAFSHFLFKFLGIVIFFPFIKLFINLLKSLSGSVPQQIALGHFLFSLFIVIIFFFLLKPFSRLVEKILPGEVTTLPLWPKWLNGKFIKEPKLALESVIKELRRMLLIAQRIFLMSADLIFDFKKSKMRDVSYTELVVDNLQREIAKFLDKVSEMKLNEKEAGRLLHYAAIVDDVERIADQSTNIAKLARYKANYNVPFTKEAQEEINQLREIINQVINDTISLLKKYDSLKVQNILAKEEQIDQMVRDIKEKHFQRFFKNICTAEAGPIFVDILVNLERISDHCVNIAEYLTEIYEKYS